MNRTTNKLLNSLKSIFVSKYKLVMNAANSLEDDKFSPYLHVIKPLLDVSKRAQIDKKVSNCPVFIKGLNEIRYKKVAKGLITNFDEIDSDSEAINWYNDGCEFYRWQYRTAQKNNIQSIATISQRVIRSLKKIGYEVEPLDNDFLLVTIRGHNAIVKIASHTNFRQGSDDSWNEKELNELNTVKQQNNCSTAIYITPGKTHRSMRSHEKKLDTFVLAGWDLVQLFNDTSFTSRKYQIIG